MLPENRVLHNATDFFQMNVKSLSRILDITLQSTFRRSSPEWSVFDFMKPY